MFLNEVFANTTNNPASTVLTNMMPLLIFIIIFYLLLIRPQQKKAEQHTKMIQNLKAGDKVITGGGIIAKVKENKEKEIVLEISKGVEIKVSSHTIESLIKR